MPLLWSLHGLSIRTNYQIQNSFLVYHKDIDSPLKTKGLKEGMTSFVPQTFPLLPRGCAEQLWIHTHAHKRTKHTHKQNKPRHTAKEKEREEIGSYKKGAGSPFPLAKFALATLFVGMMREQLFSARESQGLAHWGDGKLKNARWRWGRGSKYSWTFP